MRNVIFETQVDQGISLLAKSISNEQHLCLRELFQAEGCYYYYFRHSMQFKTISLREVSKEEYDKLYMMIRSFLPSHERVDIWQENDMEYSLSQLEGTNWRGYCPASFCRFLSETTPLLLAMQDYFQKNVRKKSIFDTNSGESSKEYGELCDFWHKKLNIPYENVACIGPDSDKLHAFCETYEKTRKSINDMSLAKQRDIYFNLFRRGPRRRKECLEELGFSIPAEADVKQLSFRELEKTLFDNLQEYSYKSFETAVESIMQMDYDARKRLYILIDSANASECKEALVELGVDVDALFSCNNFPYYRMQFYLLACMGAL